MRVTFRNAFSKFTSTNNCLSFLAAKWAGTVFLFIFFASYSNANAETELCAELTPYFTNMSPALTNPSRNPNEVEISIIDNSKIELLERTDYEMGSIIVDGDNDGKEDIFVWNIEGSGRFVYAELLGISPLPANSSSKLTSNASMELGVLDTPRFIQFKGVNYLVYSNTGDRDGTVVSQITRSKDGLYEQVKRCHMQTTIKPATQCRHPACKRLSEIIEDPHENTAFVDVEWPHKYFPPAGLRVYYSDEWHSGDFDNTHHPTTIWRVGREGYMFGDIYWKFLGQGDVEPDVDAKLRPQSEGRTERLVLPGSQHDRLRRTLAQQSEVLSNQLRRSISLPNEGGFFLFMAHGDRTYWAWDFGSLYGEEIHITYTNSKKSDYIGMVQIIREKALSPCISQCITQLDD